MATRHRFQIDGKTYTVTVDDSGDRVVIAIDGGPPTEVDVTTSGLPGLVSMIRNGLPSRAYVVREGRDFRVVLEGHTFVLGATGSRRQRGAAGGAEDAPGRVTAPLAGVVVDLRVAVGDRIEARQSLVVIEAMKMQNEVQAPHAGTVTVLHARQGVRVDKGELLMEYEPGED